MSAPAVEIERFDIAQVPTHGRPRVMELRGRQGTLALHCSREDGSLWLFAQGPAGGDRGQVVFPVHVAEQLREWIDDGARGAAPSTSGVLWLDRDDYARTVAVKRSALSRAQAWRMPLDPVARDELTTALREWATAAKAAA